jgi:hypothetical protein
MERELRRRPFAECIAQGMTNELVNLRLLLESHFGLRRMHVDIHLIGRHVEEQMHFGAAFLVRSNAVSIEDRMCDRSILDDAPVHEDVLRTAHRPLLRERGDEAMQPQAAELAVDPYQILTIAVQLVQAIRETRDG